MVDTVLLLKNKTTPRDPYYDLFSSHNITSRFLPLLEHTPVDVESLVEYLASDHFLNQTTTFIVTSHRAVEVLNSCIARINDDEVKECIWHKTGYTVGPHTAQILRQSGFKDVRGGDNAGNGSILSDIIIGEHRDAQPIMFFTGEIRRDIIPKKLSGAGIALQEKVIYKTSERSDIVDRFSELKHEFGTRQRKGWIVFFSPQGTEVIVDHIVSNGGADAFNIASIGPTTEDYLVARGIQPHIVAAKPEANALLQSMLQF